MKIRNSMLSSLTFSQVKTGLRGLCQTFQKHYTTELLGGVSIMVLQLSESRYAPLIAGLSGSASIMKGIENIKQTNREEKKHAHIRVAIGLIAVAFSIWGTLANNMKMDGYQEEANQWTEWYKKTFMSIPHYFEGNLLSKSYYFITGKVRSIAAAPDYFPNPYNQQYDCCR